MEEILEGFYPCRKATARAIFWASSGEILSNLENIFRGDGERTAIKSGLIHRAEKVSLPHKTYFLKIYYVKSWSKFFFQNLVGYNPPLKAALNAHFLKGLDFPVILPVGLFVFQSPWREKVWGGILTPYFREFEGLSDLWKEISQKKALFETVIQDLLRLLQRLQRAGVYVRDTKANNFLIRPGKEPLLFDLDQVKFFKRPLSRRLRAKNFRVLQRSLQKKGIPESWLKPWFEKLP